ncbi:hypothetical protein F4779DRAFT_614493 [Xylariaceae sp. FL0662B]|nr:hypothetical protein F4779DRAFT_614493 [Xylariaceae sp. FL0662B]
MHQLHQIFTVIMMMFIVLFFAQIKTFFAFRARENAHQELLVTHMAHHEQLRRDQLTRESANIRAALDEVKKYALYPSEIPEKNRWRPSEDDPKSRIRDLESALGVELPNDYKEFLQLTNGLSGVETMNCRGTIELFQVDQVKWHDIEGSSSFTDLLDNEDMKYINVVIGSGGFSVIVPNNELRLRDLPRLRMLQVGHERESGGNYPRQGGIYLVRPEEFPPVARFWTKIVHALDVHECLRFHGPAGYEKSRLWPAWVVLSISAPFSSLAPGWQIHPTFADYLEDIASTGANM